MSNKTENDTLITRTAYSCEKTDSENTKEDFFKAFDDRSTEVRIVNALSDPSYTLICHEYELMSGEWKSPPTYEIENHRSGVFGTRSTRWLTGASGRAVYKCPQDGSMYSFLWRNPYAGSNTYEVSTNSQTARIIITGGLGDNAVVRFTVIDK